MEVELKFFATFREAVGSKTTSRQYDIDATVGDVLRDLEAEYDALGGTLLEEGHLASQINVLKNGREVLHMEGTETQLSDGDLLSVFPPIAGGDRS